MEYSRVRDKWVLSMGPGGYDTRTSDLHQHSTVDQIEVLYSLMTQPNISVSIFHCILQSHKDYVKQLTVNGDTLQSDEQSS